MVNVEALLADTQALLARLQEGESGGPDDETFFAADPTKSISLHRPLPDPQADTALPASASSNLNEEAIDEVYEFQVRKLSLIAVPDGVTSVRHEVYCHAGLSDCNAMENKSKKTVMELNEGSACVTVSGGGGRTLCGEHAGVPVVRAQRGQAGLHAPPGRGAAARQRLAVDW